MASYKPVQRNGMFIPVVFEEQIQPGTFEFALHHLVDHELDLSACDAKRYEKKSINFMGMLSLAGVLLWLR